MTLSRRRLIRCYLAASLICAGYIVWASYHAPTIDGPWARRTMVTDQGESCARPCRFPQLETDR